MKFIISSAIWTIISSICLNLLYQFIFHDVSQWQVPGEIIYFQALGVLTVALFIILSPRKISGGNSVSKNIKILAEDIVFLLIGMIIGNFLWQFMNDVSQWGSAVKRSVVQLVSVAVFVGLIAWRNHRYNLQLQLQQQEQAKC